MQFGVLNDVHVGLTFVLYIYFFSIFSLFSFISDAIIMIFPRLRVARHLFWPWLYIRPTYFMIVTPFGTQVISYPPIYFLPAFGIALIIALWCIYYYICRPNGGICCCCRKILYPLLCQCSRRNDGTNLKKVLIITDIFSHENMKNLLSLLLLANMMKKKKIEIVGIVTTGGNNEIRARHTLEWLKYLNLSDKIPVAYGRDIDNTAELFLERIVRNQFQDGDEEEEEDEKILNKHNVSSSSTELILKLAKTYGKKLYIYSTTSIALTPLNDAIKKDKSSKYLKYIGGIYLNNLQVKRDKNKHIRKKKCCSCSSSKHIEDKNNKIIVPMNLKLLQEDKTTKKKRKIVLDEPSTHRVFQTLQLKVPFTIFSNVADTTNFNNNIDISKDIIDKILASETYINSTVDNRYKIKTSIVSKSKNNIHDSIEKPICSNDAALFGLYLDDDVNNDLILKNINWGQHCIVTKNDDNKKINKLIDTNIDFQYCL